MRPRVSLVLRRAGRRRLSRLSEHSRTGRPRGATRRLRGVIQTDGYDVYDSLKKVLPDLRRIGCAAHCRRKFYRALLDREARAISFLAQFRRLYRIEAQTQNSPPEERQGVRQTEAAPIWAQMLSDAQALRPQVLPHSSLGKALGYLINEYPALIGYLESGRYQIDNNLVENSIRVPAVGRRRWLFLGHPDAGWRSAVIYSIIISCRRRGINPPRVPHRRPAPAARHQHHPNRRPASRTLATATPARPITGRPRLLPVPRSPAWPLPRPSLRSAARRLAPATSPEPAILARPRLPEQNAPALPLTVLRGETARFTTTHGYDPAKGRLDTVSSGGSSASPHPRGDNDEHLVANWQHAAGAREPSAPPVRAGPFR